VLGDDTFRDIVRVCSALLRQQVVNCGRIEEEETSELRIAQREFAVIDISILIETEQVAKAETTERSPSWGGITVTGERIIREFVVTPSVNEHRVLCGVLRVRSRKAESMLRETLRVVRRGTTSVQCIANRGEVRKQFVESEFG
jgi:hypothetical protein